MKLYIVPRSFLAGIALLTLVGMSSCKKDGNPNKLPDVSPSDYEGKVDGYESADQIYPDNLVAHWTFDDTKNETISGTAPTQTANDAIVDGGVKGKAIQLNGGFLYFANQFEAFKTDAFQSFTISMWMKIQNNGSKRTMAFQLARPGVLTGNININVNTQAFPADNMTTLRVQPVFAAAGGGTQDNVNNSSSPVFGNDVWLHVLVSYRRATGTFDLWLNGIKAGNFPNRGTSANNLFRSYEPSEVIIGSNYNGIPGKEVDASTTYAPMTGSIDEIRIYNINLPDAHARALYNLEKAGL